jgi:outer membrane protein TolC
MHQPNWSRIAAAAAVLASSFFSGGHPLSAQTASPTVITLNEAIARARANEPAFAAAVAQSRTADLDRSIARAALLPSATYHNQFVYTQPAQGKTGSANASAADAAIGSQPRFIANNTVHEYVSQGQATETIGVQQITAVARASAAASFAKAELEVSRRGLVATVITLFYTSLSADRRVTIAQRAEDEAASFLKLTDQREQARESAHADVVKAQLLEQQRQRDLQNATIEAQKARLELGVLLFPDPRSTFALTAAPADGLASRADIETAATKSNPELQSALASLRASNLGVTSAWAAYLPDLGMSVAYGIDAPEFAIHSPNGVKNLGYSATATVDIPVWDWFSTQHKVKQAQIQRDVAKVALSATERRLIAQLDESYAEAQTAQDQLASLDLSVKTAEESLNLTRLRYTAGEATVLEVVDAQTSFTAAETAREDGTIRYQAAVANLQLLTGTI